MIRVVLAGRILCTLHWADNPRGGSEFRIATVPTKGLRSLTPTACRCGKRSGVSFDQRVFTVVTLRDGKLIQMEDFTERSQALDAAGLQE